MGYIQFGVKHWFGGSSQWLVDYGTLPLPFWIQGIPGVLYLKWKYGGLPGGPGINFGIALPLQDQLIVLQCARWVDLLIAAPCTIASVYLLTRRWFGEAAAAASALFCAIEPNLLANYVLATTDAPMVPCAVLAMLSYDDYLRERRVGKMLGAAVLFGLGLSIKVSMRSFGLLMMGACFVTWLAGRVAVQPTAADRLGLVARQSLRFLAMDVVVIVGVSLPLSWAFNGFLWGPLLHPTGTNKVAYKVLNTLGYRGDEARAKVAAMQAISVPAPLSVIRYQVAHGRGGHPMSFRGREGSSGPWYYYPYIVVMKTHLVLLGAVLIALLRRETWRSAIAWGAVLLLGFLCTTKLHGGPRYYLVLLALLAALGGMGVATLLRACRPRALRVGVAVMLAAGSLVLTLRSMPEYMTHTNPFWGGDWEGYRYADANYDWGQGLYRAFAAADRAGLRPVGFIHPGDPHYGVPKGRHIILADIDSTLAQMRGRYVVVSAVLLYHAPRIYSDLAPLFRALGTLGPDGRLTVTSFYFDLRDDRKFAALQALVEREKAIQPTLLRKEDATSPAPASASDPS